jgi:hypothetical protein
VAWPLFDNVCHALSLQLFLNTFRNLTKFTKKPYYHEAMGVLFIEKRKRKTNSLQALASHDRLTNRKIYTKYAIINL